MKNQLGSTFVSKNPKSRQGNSGMKQQSLSSSFSCAWHGVRTAIAQRNMRIHMVMAVLVLAAAFAFHLHVGQIVMLVLAIGMVIMAEIFNTAIEVLVDLVTSEYHPLAMVAKNAAAGAVLVAAVTAVVIGILVFYSSLLALLAK
ncbi:MAG: diacylglycerol kinase family protein [Bacillota bacterium]